MLIGVTGHRPERLEDNEDAVKELISEGIQHLKATRLFQGMASGTDLWSAKEAWKLKVPYTACKPWAGHTPRAADMIEYTKVLRHADEIVDVSTNLQYPGPWVYQKRNEYIVNSSEAMIAVWDGKPYGGTYNCVQYAWSKSIPVLRIDPEERTIGFIREDVPF